MAEAKRDQNYVPTLLGVSVTDGVTPVPIYADPTTHRLYVDLGTSGGSPLTTKGDIYTFSTVDTRLPVGPDGTVLSSDSTEATGLKWISASGTGTVVSMSFVTANGFSGSVATETTTPALTLIRQFASIAGVTTLNDTHGTVNCTGTTYTVTLPTAVGISGRQYTIKNSASGNITIDGNGTETIDGSLTAVLIPYTSLTVVSDNANWIII